MAKRRDPWTGLGWDAWMLGAEAAGVVTLRGLKFAAGADPDGAEARRMVVEKIEAARALQAMALSGGLGLTAPTIARKSLTHYRRRVRANLRRLSR